MPASKIIEEVLEEKNISKTELAEKIHVTKQNLFNKMARDNFSTLELVEIADALDMQLLFKDKSSEKEYLIDYPPEKKGKPKRIYKNKVHEKE